MDALQRLGQYSWVLDHLEDIESDLSVFHRVDDPYSMPAQKYLRLAERLFAYKGVMRARLEYESQQEQEREQATTAPAHRGETAREISVEALIAQTGGAHVVEGGGADG